MTIQYPIQLITNLLRSYNGINLIVTINLYYLISIDVK